jgi:uncharacterized protein YjbI with pentapeptide repeats
MILAGDSGRTRQMANEEHLKILRQRVEAWNAWREENPDIHPDLTRAGLTRADLTGANLFEAGLTGANLFEADLTGAGLNGADLTRANLTGANLTGTYLFEADLTGANLGGADLTRADLTRANLTRVNLGGANLTRVNLGGANLARANLGGANLTRADLTGANLAGANLDEGNLGGANLENAHLVDAHLVNADLTGCRVYGMSAWDLHLEGAKQADLIITRKGQPEVTVDNLEVAQFIYLLLNNEKIRDVIDTIGKKGVLLLGRFTEGRLAILERLRDELRRRDFLPMVFNFDKPETKDFTETVRLLAGLSSFVIADITNPRSAPLELQATVPECMVPFVPILEKGQEPFAMLQDLRNAHPDRVLDVIRYPSVERLVEVLDVEIIEPAKARFIELQIQKAQGMRVRDV